MKSKTTIRRHLKQLREVIDTSNDPAEQRVAQAMETAIRWATLDTVGWDGMGYEARALARLLRADLSLSGRDDGDA